MDKAGIPRTDRSRIEALHLVMTCRQQAMSSPSLPQTQPMQQHEQLDLFRALPGDMSPRDAQDLMAYPSSPATPNSRPTPDILNPSNGAVESLATTRA